MQSMITSMYYKWQILHFATYISYYYYNYILKYKTLQIILQFFRLITSTELQYSLLLHKKIFIN